MTDALMKSWKNVKLGEVLIERKERIGAIDANELSLLGVSNQHGLHRSSMPRIIDMSRYLRVDKEWFAYNPMRINVGSLGWASTESQIGVISPDYVVFSCSERILPVWIHAYLRHPVGLDAINAATAGSVRERLYFHKLAEIGIPLPPLAEQRRIVARIEALAAQIDEAKRLRKEAVVEAEALIEGAGSELAQRHSKQTITIEDLVGIAGLKNGKSVKSVPDAELPRCVTLSSMRNGRIDTTVSKPIPLEEKELQAFAIRDNDVFVVRGNGSKVLCGRAGRVDEAAPRTIFPDLFIRIDLPTERIDPAFFTLVWNSRSTREVIEEKAKTTSGIWKINQGHILTTSLPLPSLLEQRRIVAELDALQAEVDTLKRLQSETAAELDALLPAILDRAFKGEL